jgi:hypothetical protein
MDSQQAREMRLTGFALFVCRLLPNIDVAGALHQIAREVRVTVLPYGAVPKLFTQQLR